MSQPTLEERVTALEKQLADLTVRLATLDGAKDWRQAVGMFAGNEGMKQVFEEGRKIREADRKRAKQTAARGQRRAKS